MNWGRPANVVLEIGTDQLKVYIFKKGRRKPVHFLKTVRLADLKGPLEGELPPLLHSFNIRHRRVVTYLPRNMVNMRLLTIPSTDTAEVNEMVKLQGITQTPYTRAEVIVSHTLIGSRREGYSDVVLAFCQRKFIDDRINLLSAAGLKVDQVGLSSPWVADWYFMNQASEGVQAQKGLLILIDCDFSFSDVIFCRDGKFLFSRSIVSGSSQLLQSPDQKVEEFCKEVLQALELTTEEFGMGEPKKVVLITSMPPNPALRAAIEKRLGLSVEFLDPTLSLKGEIRSDVQPGVSLTPLIGCVQKRSSLFDLLPEEARLRLAVEQKGREMITTGALALGLLAAVSLLFGGYFYQKKSYIEHLEKEINRTMQIAAEIEAKLIRTNLLERLKNTDTSLLANLEKISRLLPQGMYFNSIEYAHGDKVTLKGNAGEMSEVFDFVKSLEDSKSFKGVRSEQVSKKKSGDQVLANFVIICRL